jgi:hypothetical protein
MGLGKILIIGGVVAGGAYLLMQHANATAGGANPVPGASVPPGWAPPAGATVVNLAAGSVASLNKPLTLASWPAAAGQPPGQYVVIWDASNANSFVALFYAADPVTGKAGSTPAVMAQGTTSDSALILSQIATISAAVQAKNAGTAPATAPATAGWF